MRTWLVNLADDPVMGARDDVVLSVFAATERAIAVGVVARTCLVGGRRYDGAEHQCAS
ncbi:MAG TPA: hypothetical protein VFZ85_09295 [Jiangellaceae bacterium]